MSLSKFYPHNSLQFLWEEYSSNLSRNPLAVKSITIGVLLAFGNIIAQKLKNKDDLDEPLDKKSIFAFGLFGFLVTGPLTHFFLNWLEKNGPSNWVLKLIIDRLAYGSVFLFLALYLLSIFEGQGHNRAFENLKKVYWSAWQVNLKVWTATQVVNLNFVPLKYRVLVLNVVSIFWNIYLSQKRSKSAKKSN